MSPVRHDDEGCGVNERRLGARLSVAALCVRRTDYHVRLVLVA
jgi:hypothetical protein